MTSATEELRRLLDERGVEHYDGTEKTLWLKDEHGYRASADELTSGRLSVHMWCDTPEQAVEATLGRGECRITSTIIIHDPDGYETTLDCGHVVHMPPEDFDYCPNCGRRVADD